MKHKAKKLFVTFLLGSMLLTACSNQSAQDVSTAESNSSQNAEITPAPTGTPETTQPTTESATEPSSEPTEAPAKETVILDPDKPMVALTFDDGPNQLTTVEVLDVLEEYEVTASFFLVGNNINMNTKSVIERMYEMGCEINNHSYNHLSMSTMTAEEIKKEIDNVDKMVEGITGESTKFFRPPYIAVSDTMYETIDKPFICGVGCNDWDASVTTQERIDKTLEQIKDGTIVLLHDFYGNSQTVEALKTIIPTLLDEGYQFVTVSQLFEAKGIEISGDDTRLHTFVE